MNENNIWWRLKDAFGQIVKYLPYMFIPYAGSVFSIIIMVEEIGIAIKFFELKPQVPEPQRIRNIFKNYLIGILVPVVNQLFWSKAMNGLMQYLKTHGAEQEDVLYVEKKGKIYGYLGIIGQIILFVLLFSLFPLTFILFRPPTYSLFRYPSISPSELLIFFIVLISILFGILLGFVIPSVILERRILKRIISCIEITGLDKANNLINQ